MKKILSLCVTMICACTMFAVQVTFDFSTAAGLSALGITPAASGSGVTVTDLSLNGVNFAANKGTATTDPRVWTTNSGATDFRTYNGSTLTISGAQASDLITKIEMSGNKLNFTGLSNGQWTGSANSVTFTPTATCNVTTITITMNEQATEYIPDTITVSQAKALIDAYDPLMHKGHFVKGVVAGDPFLLGSNGPAFYLTDIANPTDTLEGFKIAKDAQSTAFTGVDDMAATLSAGDTILIYAAGLALYNNMIYETTSGYFAGMIGKVLTVMLDWHACDADRDGNVWNVLIAYEFHGNPDNRFRLYFSSEQDDAIQGTYNLESGSTITINGVTSEVSGTVSFTYKAMLEDGTNTYTINLYAHTSDKTYRMNRDIDFVTSYDLDGDRPFVPNDGDTITCAQAKKHALSLATGETSIMTVTVRGFITDIFSNGITFWMDDQQGTAKTIQAFSCTMPFGVNIVNDTEVFVTGKLKNYNGTPEIDHGTVEVISGGVEIIPVEVTVSEAIAACQALQYNAVSSETYAITGYISGIVTEYSEQYGNISFWMSDNQNDNGQVFQAYRVKCDAATAAQLVVGARVTVTDKLKHFHQDATEGENPKPERTLYETNGGGAVKLISDTNDDDVPSDAVLANYYNQGKVCACFYVPANMACNNIVVTGQFNDWSSIVAECAPAVPVEGYDGWYVASFDPVEQSEFYGVSAKPIMLDVDGNFNWDYQIGAATSIRGGVQVVQGAYAGEIDLITYGTDAPNVFTVDAWKNNPCTAIYHNYTVTVVSAGCDGRVVPYLVGAMNGWTFQQMQYNAAKTADNNGVPTYDITFKAAEGTAYQIVSGKLNDAGEMEVQPGWYDDAYMQMLVNGAWVRIPGENVDNQLTHENPNIVWDLRVDTLQWARCDETPAEYVVMWVNLPEENRPEAVEIIGGFDGWAGTAMELLNTGWHFVELEAKANQYFKFRGAGSWDVQLEFYNAENNEWYPIQDNQLVFGQLWSDDTYKGVPCKMIEIDLSNPNYFRWSQAEAPTQSTQENVYVIYRNRDNGVIDLEQVTLTLPEAPIIPGFTFLKWVVVAGDLDEGINIQATYQYNGDATSAPAAFVNPANPAQKLIRNGNVYILHNGNTYTATGVKVE